MSLVPRLAPFTQTIFAQMSALALRTGAINLGQGFPDSDGPASVLEAARQAIATGVNQYPPGPGIPELREAVALARAADHGHRLDPDTEVLITNGATEGIAAALLALCDEGDEVLMLEPFYDSYPAVVAMARGRSVGVPLSTDADGGLFLDLDRLAAAITDRSRILVLNTPHNPTGAVLTEAELAGIAELCVRHDLLVIVDEVYEYLTFDDARHLPIATLPGMAERTLTISSAGKSFNITGWKVGWVMGSAELVAATRAVKQFLTFVGGAPFQPAVALALREERDWTRQMALDLAGKRERLSVGLRSAGLQVWKPRGTYFVIADIAGLGHTDGMAFCNTLPERAGVVAVPAQVFYSEPTRYSTLVRFAFCKADAVIDEAVARLRSADLSS